MTAQQRRDLKLTSINDCLNELHQLVDADAQGKLIAMGNWQPGQVFAHVAAWIEYGYDGYPIKAPPLPIRWFLRWRLPKILNDGMSAGVRIPGIKDGTVGQDVMETKAAAMRLERALKRLSDGEQAKYESPAFGPMSHEDRIRLNLRHAELHLSFLATDF